MKALPIEAMTNEKIWQLQSSDWGFPARHGGTPRMMVYFMENSIKMDDMTRGTYFRKPPDVSSQ